MEIKGTIYSVGTTKQVSDNFSKREFILKDSDEKYPNYLTMQLSNKNVDLITESDVNASVTVSFNLRGRLWLNKENQEVSFNSIDAWKIVKETVNF